MTQHYSLIRREVYELKVSGKYLKRRKIKDMARLFKPLYWVLFFITMLSIIASLVILVLSYNSILNIFWAFIPTLIICATLMIIDSVSEKYLYKKAARDQEIIQEKDLLQKYLKDVKDIFVKYDLNDNALALLKSECENRVNNNKTKSGMFRNKIIDIIIIAPIAAILTLLVDASKQPNIEAIVIILYLGAVLLAFIKAITPLQGVWNNTHKDQCLLDTLNDLEYIKVCDTQ